MFFVFLFSSFRLGFCCTLLLIHCCRCIYNFIFSNKSFIFLILFYSLHFVIILLFLACSPFFLLSFFCCGFVLLYCSCFNYIFIFPNIYIYFSRFLKIFIYLFLAVLGLSFCVRAFSSCGERGPLLIAVHGPLTIAASPVAEHRLQTHRLSSCGSRA